MSYILTMVKTIMDTFVVNWKRNYEFMVRRLSFLNSFKLSNIFGYSKSMFTKNIFLVTDRASSSLLPTFTVVEELFLLVKEEN